MPDRAGRSPSLRCGREPGIAGHRGGIEGRGGGAGGVNILLTSIGRRGYPASWFRDALAGVGKVHAGGSDRWASGPRDADVASLLPPVADPRYGPELVRYCAQHRIDAVIPLIDVDVVAIADVAEALRAVGTEPIVPSPGVARRTLDKWATTTLLAEAGLDHPPTFLGVREAQRAASEGSLAGPLIIKPRSGTSALGMLRIERAEDLLGLEGLHLVAGIGTHLPSGPPERTDDRQLVQPLLAGDEFNIDVVNDLRGDFVAVLARERLAFGRG